MVEPLRIAHVGVLTVAVLVNLGIVYWVRTRAEGRASWLFQLNIAFATVYAGLGVVEALVPGYWPKLVASALRTPALWAAVIVWVGFAYRYAGRDAALTRRRWAGLAAVGAASTLFQVTDPVHGLAFENVRLDPEPFPHLVGEPTTLFWVATAPAYLLLLLSVGVLGKALLTSRRVSRRQPLLLASGILPAIAVSVGQTLGYLPRDGFSYLSVTGAGFSVVLAYALFDEDLFAVDPVSRAAVIESVTDAVVVLDGRERLVDFNGAATDLGVSEADISRDVGEVLPGLLADGGTVTPDGGTSATVAAADGDSVPGDESLAGTPGTGTAPDGDADTDGGGRFADRLVATTAAGRRQFVVQPSIVGDADAPSGYVVVLRDVTAVEAYAARLERQTDQLDRFASTVSHDLRNPLSVARAYVETAADDGDLDRLEEAVDALDRADDIIDQSLTLAREGRAIEGREPIALASAAHDAWTTAETDGAVLEVRSERTLSADPDRLTTLLENLFRNAVRHGDAGTVRVHDEEGGFVVEDDGTGIPADEREDVFERGYTTHEDGTGLGLAIVESIADAHGWGVTVGEGREGGARFTFDGVEVVDHADTPGAGDTESADTDAAASLELEPND